ncbi:hypothetical protein ACWD3J_48275 [Streptomyces sp. NPDC002755]|uniref:hypothetical protein n=1 Tax=Streptomyces sp. NPDC002884 TaxID=3154544 RepID=UPI003317481C
MSQNTPTTELTSQYTAQVTADLERNAKEQERVSAEIAALQEQLAAFQRNHTVLVSIQQAIATAPAPDTPAQPSDTAAVPNPRKKAATSRTSKPAQPRKAASQPAGKKTDRTRADRAEPAQTAQPTLVDLVRAHLTKQSEPRSAAEIATALGQAHPERTIKTTVVRTTLEGLVAKTQAQRSKQGSSVFYAADSAPAATEPGSLA